MTQSRGCSWVGTPGFIRKLRNSIRSVRAYETLLILLTLAAIFFGILAPPASATTYQYDPNGRLQSVTNSAGDTAHYVYDVRGNLVRIERTASTQLAITSFSPNNGVPGIQVVINGSGFGATTGTNTVAFNGVNAAVLSASATQLLVQVPQTASSGPLSITVAGSSVTSAESFTVAQIGQPPSISGLSPSIGTYGSTVTISGQHLNPVPGQTTVLLNGVMVAPIAIADQQITFLIPPFVSSGAITVSTPFGSAVSSGSVTVVPIGIDPGSVASEYAPLPINGAPTSIALPTANTYIALLFQGTAGDYDTLLASSLSPANQSIIYTVTSPTGTVIATGNLASFSLSNPLPQLVTTGTYMVLLQSGPDSVQVSLSIAKDLNGTLTSDGASSSFITGYAAQPISLDVSGIAGSSISIGINNLTFTPASVTSATVNVYEPDGLKEIPISCGTDIGGCAIYLKNLFLSGTYRVQVVPGGPAAMGLTAALSTPISATVPTDGSSSNFSTNTIAQAVWLNFPATAGQSITTIVRGFVMSPATGYGTVNVYKPDGTLLSTETCQPGVGDCLLQLDDVPISGTYQMQILPSNAATMSFAAIVALPLSQSIPVDETNTSLATVAPGQSILLNFNATSGQALTATISAATLVPSGGYLTFDVFEPDGTYWATQSCFPSSIGCVMNLGYLPETGTYQLRIRPSLAETMTLTATLSVDVSETLLADGNVHSVSTTTPGQAVSLSIAGTAGQSLGVVNIQNLTFSPTAVTEATVYIYKPDGTLLESPYAVGNGTTCFATTACSINLSYFPVTGNYMIEVVPNGAATMSFGIVVGNNLAETLANDGSTGNYSTTIPGQGVVFDFSGTMGENTGLVQIQGLTAAAYVYVYGPDGAVVLTQYCAASSTCAINLNHLPSTGNYQLQVVPVGSGSLSFSVNTVANVTGTLTTDGSSNSFATTIPGQSVGLSFSGSASDNLGVVTLQSSVSGQILSGAIYVYAPDGSQIAMQECSASACSINLSYLPQTGSYQLQVLPGGSSTQSFSASVSPNVTWTLPTSGAVTSVATTTLGQIAYLRFYGVAGQNVTANIPTVAFTPVVFGQILDLTINQPNGQGISQVCITVAPCVVRINNLPATGIYQIQVSARGTAKEMTFGANAVMDLAIQLAPDGTSHTLTTTAQGQIVSVIVNGMAGQNLDFGISNLSFNSSTTDQANMVVYSPSGVVMGPGTMCFSISSYCTIHLGNIPVNGLYQIQISPAGQSSMTFTGTLVSDLVGALTSGDAASGFSTTIPGQVMALSFSGGAGQVMNLGVVAPNSAFNGTVMVFKPDGTGLLSNPQSCYGACSISLGTLPVGGTYQVVIAPNSLSTFSVAVAVAPPSPPVPISLGALPVTVTVNSTGPASVSFDATMGHRLGIWITSSTFSGLYHVSILNPDGTTKDSASGYGTTSPVFIGPEPLEQTGTYTISIGGGGASGSVAIQVVEVPADVVAPITLDGSAVTATVASAGQGADLTFSGTAGQTVFVQITSDSFGGASSGAFSLSILNPDHTSLQSSTSGSIGSIFGPYVLSQNGTYTIAISPVNGGTGWVTTQLVSQLNNTNGTTTIGGPAATMDAIPDTSGATLTFNGVVGQRIGLNITGNPTSAYTLTLTNPDGTTEFSTATDPYALFWPYTLQQAGTYTLNLQVSDSAGSMTLQVVSVPPDTTATIVENAGAVTVSTTAFLQAADLTFVGAAGQNITVNLSNFNLVGSIYATYGYCFISIMNPDGTALLSPKLAFGGSSAGTYTLPQSGTYTIVIMPIYGTGSMTVGLTGS